MAIRLILDAYLWLDAEKGQTTREQWAKQHSVVVLFLLQTFLKSIRFHANRLDAVAFC